MGDDYLFTAIQCIAYAKAEKRRCLFLFIISENSFD